MNNSNENSALQATYHISGKSLFIFSDRDSYLRRSKEKKFPYSIFKKDDKSLDVNEIIRQDVGKFMSLLSGDNEEAKFAIALLDNVKSLPKVELVALNKECLADADYNASTYTIRIDLSNTCYFKDFIHELMHHDDNMENDYIYGKALNEIKTKYELLNSAASDVFLEQILFATAKELNVLSSGALEPYLYKEKHYQKYQFIDEHYFQRDFLKEIMPTIFSGKAQISAIDTKKITVSDISINVFCMITEYYIARYGKAMPITFHKNIYTLRCRAKDMAKNNDEHSMSILSSILQNAKKNKDYITSQKQKLWDSFSTSYVIQDLKNVVSKEEFDNHMKNNESLSNVNRGINLYTCLDEKLPIHLAQCKVLLDKMKQEFNINNNEAQYQQASKPLPSPRGKQ